MTEMIAVAIAAPADGPSFRGRAFRNVDVDVAPIEQRRLDAADDRPRADVDAAAEIDSFITSRRLPVTVILPLPSIARRFDGQQLAADIGPGQTGHDTDHCGSLSISPKRYFGTPVFQGSSRCATTDFFLEIASSFTPCGQSSPAHAPDYARPLRAGSVAADHQQQGVVVDRPFLGGSRGPCLAMAMFRDQMLARDLDLLGRSRCSRRSG